MESTQDTSDIQDINQWNVIKKQFKLDKIIGEGAFGTVYRAENLKTGQKVAIKLITNIQKDPYLVRKVIRELMILRKLSSIHDSIFTVKCHDIILPDGVITSNDGETKVASSKYNLTKLTHLFIVMEEIEMDVKKMINLEPKFDLNESHVTCILYNMLCAMKMIHSANIIHRDIKPANILIDMNCNVKICDFGLARTLPNKTDDER